MNDLVGVYILWRRDLLRYRRNPWRVLSSLVFPLLFLLILGGGLRRAVGPLASDVDYIQFLYPGILAMSVLMAALMAGVSVVWEREFGFLKEVLVAPISRWAVAAGKALGGATVALVQGALLLFFAPLVGVNLFPWALLKALPILFLLALGVSALGVLIASRVKNIEGFFPLTQMFIFPLIFLSGALFPVTGLPRFLEVVVKINPVSYGVDALRQAMLNSGESLSLSLWGHPMSLAEEVTLMAGLVLILTFLAAWSFSRQE